MNAALVLADLETAREIVLRALERVPVLGALGLGGTDPGLNADMIVADLRHARHLMDRAVNEVRYG